MKKIITVLLVAMILSFVACSGKDGQPANGNEITDSLELVNKVWANVPEEQKFSVGGGDSENLNFEGPAVFDVTKTEELDFTLGFPVNQAGKIDDAASMMNAMMANHFTAGVYRVTDVANVQAVADALKDNIMARRWVCGTPEKLLVISIDNYVISAFGLNDFVEPFKAAVSESYENATVLYEEEFTF